MALELSRYCIPWTPLRRKLRDATVMLVSTAGIYHPPDAPFEVEGDLSYRCIPSSATAAELRYADAHYPHDCIDVDLNCVFPTDRLRDLVRDKRIGGVTELHFSTGFTMALRDLRDQTVPALVAEVTQQRPDVVVLTGGWRLCHRTVVSIQRVIEMQGIATVLITVEPEESMQARPPRALAPRGYTAGHSLGRANDAALQCRILSDALELLEHPSEPGTLVTREYAWASERVSEWASERVSEWCTR